MLEIFSWGEGMAVQHYSLRLPEYEFIWTIDYFKANDWLAAIDDKNNNLVHLLRFSVTHEL